MKKEMNILQKKRFVIGIIVFLLLINISAISTIVFHKYHYAEIKNDSTNINFVKNNNINHHLRVKNFIREELSLTDKQFTNYCKLKDENINKTELIFAKMSEYRKLIIEEIKEEYPDTVLLNKFSNNIGKLHTQMQLETIRHFLQVKKNLDKGQIEKFNIILSRMNEHKRGIRGKNYKHNKKRNYRN